MYIHRIVIDTTHINTWNNIRKKDMKWMNLLEALDKEGIVEIQKTTTMAYEMRGWERGKEKSKNYKTIGGNGISYLSDGNYPDSLQGACVYESKYGEIAKIVFGTPAPEDENSRRDILHLDQAHQNAVDFFITIDGKLLNAAKSLLDSDISPIVCSAETCFKKLEEYFISHYGTNDKIELKKRLEKDDLILLGSNDCGPFAFFDKEGEKLLSAEIEDTTVKIAANIKSKSGLQAVTVIPGQNTILNLEEGEIKGEEIKSDLQVGNSYFQSFVIKVGSTPMVAARILRSGRLLFYKILLYDKNGREIVRIDKESLKISKESKIYFKNGFQWNY